MTIGSADRLDLRGQVAVVTGGRGDIGGAIVAGLVAAGARVSVADVVPNAAADDGDVLHRVVDVAQPGPVAEWLDEVERSLGTPTIVVPAAATVAVGSVLDLDPKQWTDELAVDLNGPYFVARDAAKRMIANGKPGRIVMIGSWAGHAPHRHAPAYSVAKAGLRMLTQCLALELAPAGILVNEVAIGVVDAGVSRRVFEARPELYARSVQQVPTGQLVGVDEIVREVIGLCDPARSSMTGATVLLDGGISLRAGLDEQGPTQ